MIDWLRHLELANDTVALLLIGYVVVLSEDVEQYLHVHAIENQENEPETLFETAFFPKAEYIRSRYSSNEMIKW